jgi:hypothetical protein
MHLIGIAAIGFLLFSIIGARGMLFLFLLWFAGILMILVHSGIAWN